MGKNKKPLVSVIVPCFNQGKFIIETLESVSKQTFTNFECIVVNDGSTDDSLVKMKSFCEDDPRFHYIDKFNEGVSVARNTAIRQSRGKYILPLDADDKIADTYLEKTVAYIEAHPEVKLVCTNTRLFGAKKTDYELPEYEYRREICRNVLVCTALFRKKDFDKTPGYNPQMVKGLEDWDFWLSFLKEEDIVHRIDEYLFFYRMKYDSRNRNSFKSYARIRQEIWENHKDIYANYFFNPVESDEYQTLLNSKEYKIGKMLSPILNMRWCYYLIGFIKRNGRNSNSRE